MIKQLGQLALILSGGAGLLLWMSHQWSPVSKSTSAKAIATPTAAPLLKQYNLAHSNVYVLSVPPGNPISIALSPTTESLEQFAQRSPHSTLFNAGFFDPVNQQTTSYVIINGQITADPARNPRLIQNPTLQPYLKKILNRSEFRVYSCKSFSRTLTQYEITFHNAPTRPNCQIMHAIGGGPQLSPTLTAEAEAFTDTAKGRDAIGTTHPNARTAIGITRNGTVLLVMAAQKPNLPQDSGMTLSQLAKFMQTQGAEQALNLDGGSSSSFLHNGQPVYGKRDNQGNPVKRSIKSVIVVKDEP